jgi:D-serine deaminase-like pyridoxal phosphate-dependent protein
MQEGHLVIHGSREDRRQDDLVVANGGGAVTPSSFSRATQARTCSASEGATPPTDHQLPVVLGRYSESGRRAAPGFEVFAVNDQHAFVRIPADTQIRPGEILSFGISHPCGGFDRWRFIPIVAPNHDVIGGVEPDL